MSLRFDHLAMVAGLLMLGCASTGEEQNYKELNEDREMFRTEPDDGYSSAEMQVFQITAAFEQDESADTVTDPDSILNRESWPVVSIEPVDGATTHRPYYFRDCPIDKTYVDVLGPPTVEQRLNAALEHERAANWSGANLLGGVVQPVKFAADTLRSSGKVLRCGSRGRGHGIEFSAGGRFLTGAVRFRITCNSESSSRRSSLFALRSSLFAPRSSLFALRSSLFALRFSLVR